MIVVVLPAFNEEEGLPPLLAAFADTAPACGSEMRIVVVNDGSSDRTRERALDFADRLRVEVVDHGTNQGLGAAWRTGLRRALELFEGRAPSVEDVVVTMDADNTHPPSLIPQMLGGIRAGSDLVIASRYQAGARVHGLSLPRRLIALAGGWVFRGLLPIRGARDYTCGYRAYRVELLRRANERYGAQLVSETGFTATADLLLKLRPLRPVVTEVPIELGYDRKRGASKMRVGRTMWRSLHLALRRRIGRMD